MTKTEEFIEKKKQYKEEKKLMEAKVMKKKKWKKIAAIAGASVAAVGGVIFIAWKVKNGRTTEYDFDAVKNRMEDIHNAVNFKDIDVFVSNNGKDMDAKLMYDAADKIQLVGFNAASIKDVEFFMNEINPDVYGISDMHTFDEILLINH